MPCIDCMHMESMTRFVTLDTGQLVCNYCPDYAAECLERERDARRLLGLQNSVAREQLQRRKAAGISIEKVVAVVKRLQAA